MQTADLGDIQKLCWPIFGSFWPPTYPDVDVRWHLTNYLPNVSVDIWDITPLLDMYLIFLDK